MVESLGGGRYRLSGSRVAYAVADKNRTWVFIDGRTYLVERDDRDAPARRRATDDEMALSAPMPATVVAVNVAPGQEVAEGDLLVVLEAMKMELAIRAPRRGRVASIACRVGELAQPGVALLELD